MFILVLIAENASSQLAGQESSIQTNCHLENIKDRAPVLDGLTISKNSWEVLCRFQGRKLLGHRNECREIILADARVVENLLEHLEFGRKQNSGACRGSPAHCSNSERSLGKLESMEQTHLGQLHTFEQQRVLPVQRIACSTYLGKYGEPKVSSSGPLSSHLCRAFRVYATCHA